MLESIVLASYCLTEHKPLIPQSPYTPAQIVQGMCLPILSSFPIIGVSRIFTNPHLRRRAPARSLPNTFQYIPGLVPWRHDTRPPAHALPGKIRIHLGFLAFCDQAEKCPLMGCEGTDASAKVQQP